MSYRKPPALKYMRFTNAQVERARTGNRLWIIDSHMSNQCNLHCPTCYRDAGKSLAKELTFEECKNILRQAKALGAQTWLITGSGEPFMDPKLLPLIEYARTLRMNVVVFTNNTFITRDLAFHLFDRKVSIVAKLNSFVPDIQDFFVGTPGAHRNIYQGLQILMDAGFNKTCPSRLGIDSVIVRQNYREIPKIFRFCRDNNIVPYITTELHGGRGVKNAQALDITVNGIKRIFYYLRDVDRMEYGFDWMPHPPIVAGGSCRKIIHQLFVGPTGEIGFCPGLGTSLGNIRKVTLTETLKSELVQKIRHPEKFYQPCKICKDKNPSCTGGCLLSKYSAGDLFGTDPQCKW
jgi:MoaA/NifB/PqqE/SkfB family radical SAM enzyme